MTPVAPPAGLTVHTYTAAEPGLFVNSYLLETPSGVVVVDGNLLVSDTAALIARLAALHKPLLGVFVTHAHPDHFNGVLELVRAHPAPVFAARSVASTIREIAAAKRAQWGPVYGAEWPAETYFPDAELRDGEQVSLDGLTITAHEVGPAESHADSYLLVRPPQGEPLALLGDLVFQGTHPYTADGHSGAWLAVLDRLEQDLAEAGVRRLLPGHGAPTDPAQLADQRRYLLFYREAVRRLAAGAPRLDDAAKADLAATLQRFLPGAPLTWMIGLGADAVAAELAAAGQASPGGPGSPSSPRPPEPR
jgi:glyoxylase-like metal-dependent hydrolase (beta-lactamase superfamily II)